MSQRSQTYFGKMEAWNSKTKKRYVASAQAEKEEKKKRRKEEKKRE